MKIAFILTQSLESPSGLGRYWPLARELTTLGHQISILATHPNYSQLEQTEFSKDGVLIRYVAPMHVQKTDNRKIYYSTSALIGNVLTATWKLSKAALNTNAELIHVGKPHPMNGMAGLVSKVLKGRRLYLDCDDFEAGSNRFQSGWQQSILAKFERWMPSQVSFVTTNTYFMQDQLISWGIPKEKIAYLPNGVDRHRFRKVNSMQANSLRDQLNLTGRKVIAYIGTLSIPSHPVDLLLRAYYQVNQRFPNTSLLIVGAGEDYDNLQGLAHTLGIQETTLFTGRVDPEEVPVYYKLADCVVDPVRDDPAAKGRSPLKMFESWASGIPFVTADVGDRRKVMGDPPAGLLAVPGDANSLAECIMELINHPQKAENLSNFGLERVANFYWDKLAQAAEKIYFQ